MVATPLSGLTALGVSEEKSRIPEVGLDPTLVADQDRSRSALSLLRRPRLARHRRTIVECLDALVSSDLECSDPPE